jgi:hypothetical protein
MTDSSEADRAERRRREAISRRFAERERHALERATAVQAHASVPTKAVDVREGAGIDYRATTCAEWKILIPRRARQWAAEDVATERARVAAIVAARVRREAEWPVERIRELMANPTRPV